MSSGTTEEIWITPKKYPLLPQTPDEPSSLYFDLEEYYEQFTCLILHICTN